MERGGKRLVICCDGTWNEPDQEVHDNPADETEPTNVLKIVRGLAPVDREQVPQVVYYDTGVGTQGPADKYVGGGLGGGLSENIQQAYRFIANNWREGDEIFLFGFSRGAYCNSSSAGAIFSALCTIRASAKSASVSRYACKALKMTSSSSKRTLGSCNKPPTKAITSVLAAR